MTRAVIVSPDPTSRSGGVERMCSLLRGILDDAGWEVEIVGSESEPARWLYRLGAGHLAHSWQATASARAAVPDLLVTNGYLGLGAPRATKHVHVYHGTMVGDTRAEGALPWREKARRLVGGSLAEALSGRGATVVCVSESAAREVRRYYGVRSDAVIPNGVDTDLFRPRSRAEARATIGLKQDAKYALFVGRVQHRKGADLLVESCRAAGWQLLIAGPGSEPSANNLGVLEPSSLAVAYAAADCVVFPSRYEACSYVVLEALASGTPLLTTKVGWMPTFLRGVPEYEALCVRPDCAEIAARLGELDRIDTGMLAGLAREWILEHNSLVSYAARWQELLSSLGFPSGASGAGESRSLRHATGRQE